MAVPVETDLTFRISTDGLVTDVAINTIDGVTALTGPGGTTLDVTGATNPSDSRAYTNKVNTVTADLTETSPLAGWEAGRAKSVHLYRLKSKARRNAPAVTLNAGPVVGQWTNTNGVTAYQAGITAEISDLIQLNILPSGGGDLISARYWAEGVRHQITASGEWLVTLNISRADENPSGGFFQLGASAFGDGSGLTW